MAEEILEKELCFFSRNLKKAMVRNTVQGGSLQKDLNYIQKERKRLAHSWEVKKQEFAQRRKCAAKLPVILATSDAEEKGDSKEHISEQRCRESSAMYRKSDKSVLGRNELGSVRQPGVGKQVFTKVGANETNLACMPLTVKDISRMLSCDKSLPTIASDAQCTSPRNPHINYRQNSFHINKETTTRNDMSSPCPPRPPIQYIHRGPHRTRSLDQSELTKSTGDSKLMSRSPGGIPLRKRATTLSSWKPKQSELSAPLGSEQYDGMSNNLHKVFDKDQFFS